jgi:hypothetical protein
MSSARALYFRCENRLKVCSTGIVPIFLISSCLLAFIFCTPGRAAPGDTCIEDGGEALCSAPDAGLWGYDYGPVHAGAASCLGQRRSSIPSWGFDSLDEAIVFLEEGMVACTSFCDATASDEPVNDWHPPNPGNPNAFVFHGIESRQNIDYIFQYNNTPGCPAPPFENIQTFSRDRAVKCPPGYTTSSFAADGYCYRPQGDYCPVPESNPITPSRGSKRLTETDYRTPSGPGLTRFYNSFGTASTSSRPAATDL